jgi:hypothetical protein
MRTAITTGSFVLVERSTTTQLTAGLPWSLHRPPSLAENSRSCCSQRGYFAT